MYITGAGKRQPIGIEQVRRASRDVIPVFHTDEELWQPRQFSVDNQQSEQTVETCVGKVVVVPVMGKQVSCFVL